MVPFAIHGDTRREAREAQTRLLAWRELRYDGSLYSNKIDHVLAFKRIEHYKVDVSRTLPRPEITELLGIAYRRIPILAIGNDVYCDTSVIVPALERRFPPASGYGTIFPKPKHGGSPNTGLIRAFAKFYAESNLSRPLTTFVPWDKFPAAFLEDRSELFGSQIDPEAIVASRPASLALLSSHLVLIEEQLSDSHEWLFDTESPSLADISVHFILSWGRVFMGTESLFDPERNPFTVKWLDRLSAEIEKAKQSLGPSIKLDGATAAAKIVSSEYEAYDVVGFDAAEAARFSVALGDRVQVTPEDTGRNHPTSGKLVALTCEEIVLEIQGGEGLIRCHFPRFGFSVKHA